MDTTKKWMLMVCIVLLASIFSTGLGVPAYSEPDEPGNVHGTVVDEDGEDFYSVKVMAFSSSGSLVSTRHTDRDGFFRFALESGSYKIIFEKEGYVEVEKSISVPAGFYTEPENDPVKLGEIVLEKALRLSSSVLSRVVNPGDTVLLPFTISNIGEESEEVEFSVTSPGDWTTRILDQSGEVKRVLLSSDSLSLDLEVNIPINAVGNASVSLIASGKTTSTLDFMLLTQSIGEIDLTSTFPFVSAELGRTIYYPLSIENTGDSDETVDLVGIVPDGWELQFITENQMEVLSLYLTSGQSEKLTIEVSSPDDASVGEYKILVNVMSKDGELRDSLELGANLREATSDVEIISTFTEVTAEAGKSIKFPIAIWNKGDRDALFLLTVMSAPDNWKTVFTSEDIEVSSFLITAGESLSLKLEVTPPSVVSAGEYPIVIYAESDDGLIKKQIELKASVVGSFELELELSTLYTTVTTGASKSFTAQVTNRGQSPVTAVYLEAEAPEDWEVSISPVQVATLEQRQSSTFNVVVETPADTVAGDYLITMQVLSDQAESDEVQLRMTAKASTSWGFIGIGVALVFIVGLVIIFMKFKRR